MYGQQQQPQLSYEQLQQLKQLLMIAIPQLEATLVGATPPATVQGQAPNMMPTTMPQTAQPVNEGGVHIGRLALWVAPPGKNYRFSGEVTIWPNSGNPQQPDASYKIFLQANTDPTKKSMYYGSAMIMQDGADNVKVANITITANSKNTDPNVTGYVYVNFTNGYTLEGNVHNNSTQISQSGNNPPAYVANLRMSANNNNNQPQQQQQAPQPQQMVAPTAGMGMMSVQPQAPAPGTLPVPGAAQMPQNLMQQQPQVAPQQQAPQVNGNNAANLATMSPQELMQYAMQVANQQPGM